MEELNKENLQRIGYSPAFPLMSIDDLVRLGEQLGLSASRHQLSLLQSKLWKQGNRYTFDEIYAADAYLKEFRTYHSDIRIHSAEIENSRAGEAFADLINKYGALGRSDTPSLDELPSIYNGYLKALRFAPSKEDVSIIPTTPLAKSKSIFEKKVTNILSRAPHTSFALAQTNGSYRFNAKKERIANYQKTASSIRLICVMLPEEAFAWKELCDKIDRSAHMSADILLALPVGAGGIWHTLNGCGCSCMLDRDSLSSLFEKEVRPADLSAPICAAILFSRSDTVAPMITALEKWGYTAARIGTAVTQNDYLSISWGGVLHTVSYDALSCALTPKVLSLVIPSGTDTQNSVTVSNENGVYCLSFEELGFDVLSAHLEKVMNEMTHGKTENRLSLAFSLPIDVSEGTEITSVANRLSEFLAIYRACALRAIPISAHVFPRSDKSENAAVWIWDESKHFEG